MAVLSVEALPLVGWTVIARCLPEESVKGNARLYLARHIRKRTEGELMGYPRRKAKGGASYTSFDVKIHAPSSKPTFVFCTVNGRFATHSSPSVTRVTSQKRPAPKQAAKSGTVKVFRCGPQRDGGGWACVGPR
jgi:hypothetical protein